MKVANPEKVKELTDYRVGFEDLSELYETSVKEVSGKCLGCKTYHSSLFLLEETLKSIAENTGNRNYEGMYRDARSKREEIDEKKLVDYANCSSCLMESKRTKLIKKLGPKDTKKIFGIKG